MKKTLIPFLALLTMLAFAAPAPAQFYPDPVDLGIDNEQQQIEPWFWPALARQLLLKRDPQPPTQCQLMSLALADKDDAAASPDCCLAQGQTEVQAPAEDQAPAEVPAPAEGQDQAEIQAPNVCERPLGYQQIIKVLEPFGLLAEVVAKPANSEQVYEHLSNGRALLVEFLIAKDKRHAYLVRGISWTDEGQALILINDPHVTEPFKSPLAEELPGWRTVIAIQIQ